MIRIKNTFIGFYLLLSCLFSVDTIADKHLNKIDADNVLGKKISQIEINRSEEMTIFMRFHGTKH